MNKKIILILLLLLISLGVLYYYFDLSGLLYGLFGIGGGSSVVFKRKQQELEKLEKDIEKQVDEYEKELDNLEKNGVKNKTDQEEVDYWKNQ